MIITVSGPHGTGKSTYAARLANTLNLRHVSAGGLFRKLARQRKASLEKFGSLALKDPSIDHIVDEMTLKEAKKGSVVLDGQLAGWVLKDKSDLRIYLTAPEPIRLERIAKRDKLTIVEATKQTRSRESIQQERYLKHYGFRVDDLSVYHLVLDTSLGNIEDTAKILVSAANAVKNSLRQRKF